MKLHSVNVKHEGPVLLADAVIESALAPPTYLGPEAWMGPHEIINRMEEQTARAVERCEVLWQFAVSRFVDHYSEASALHFERLTVAIRIAALEHLVAVRGVLVEQSFFEEVAGCVKLVDERLQHYGNQARLHDAREEIRQPQPEGGQEEAQAGGSPEILTDTGIA